MNASIEAPMPEGGDAAPAAPRKRRWPRRLALAFVLMLVTLAVVGPVLAASWLRGEIERRGTERLDGTVTLEDLSIALNGKVVLNGLTVVGDDGEMALRVPIARLDIGLRSFLTGRKDVALLVEDAEIDLVRDEDGRWNVAKLVETMTREAAETREPDDDADEREPPPQGPMDVHGRLEIVNATITARSPETALELRGVHFTIGLDGPDKDTAIRLDALLFGGDGDAGVFHADVSVWPDAGPGLSIDDVSAKGLELGAIAEAMKLVGSPLPDGSVLDGEADLVVRGGLADLRPDAAFTLEVDAETRGLVVDMQKDGVSTFQLDEETANAEIRAQGDGDGAEPSATAEIRARDGRLVANAAWDGAADPGLTFVVDVDGVEASAGLAPYLARVHPAFATASAFDGANLGGLVTSHLEFAYGAPLPLASLTGDGLASLSTEPLSGTGSLRVDEGLVKTSPFVAELLEAFGEPTDPKFDLKPLGFAVDSGRIRYTKPWTWTIEGTETRFEGSVGIDKSLDLSWVVPVDDGLANKNSVLRALDGETLKVALTGTLTSPRFDLAGAVQGLAAKFGKNKLQEELDRQREKLQEELGGGATGGDAASDALRDLAGGADIGSTVEKAAKGILGEDADAATLLKEADRLWGEGKKAEAATIYRRIRKDFPLSPTYLLNKKRIKGRRNG